MSYASLRKECLARKVLYEDTQFPAIAHSVYYSKTDRNIVWKRPGELVENPQLVIGGTSRFDIHQGSVGNCWYIAGVATIATRPELFQKVVPDDQGFGEDYAGIFRFYFWRFGQWVEVVIDDRLPTYKGRDLIFCRNRNEPNEFWAPLLEKAYAKLHGSYEALDGGWTEDALVDMTGGIGMRQDLKDKSKISEHMFNTMLYDYNMNSLMACSISATSETMESVLQNGLVIGHAYSITKVAQIADKTGKQLQLVRLRNPWGQKEWNGAWSDNSNSWLTIDEVIRKEMRQSDENGEFWMSFEDWIANYQELQMCHLPPDNRIKDKHAWQQTSFHSEWVRGVSAGGCGNPPHRDLYWINPQYSVTLKESDDMDRDGKCTLIVSLLQKYSRAKRTQTRSSDTNVAMSFSLYKIKSHFNTLLDGSNYSSRALQLQGKRTTYVSYREITEEYKLDPGTYVIIPSLFEVNQECQFLLRCYSEHAVDSIEMDIPTEPILEPKSADDVIQDLFLKYCGEDKVIDARELQCILNEAYQKELGESQLFELESCRSMLAMMDENQSGVLEWPEVRVMWKEINVWRDTFLQFDKDKNSTVDVQELRSIFHSIGYTLSKTTLKSIVRRYGGKEGKLSYNDFVMVVTKVASHIKVFCNHSKEGGLNGHAKFTLDEYMEMALYF